MFPSQSKENVRMVARKKVSQPTDTRQAFLALSTNQTVPHRRCKSISTVHLEDKIQHEYNNKENAAQETESKRKRLSSDTRGINFKVSSANLKLTKETLTEDTEEVFVDAKEYFEGNTAVSELSSIEARRHVASATYLVKDDNIIKQPAIKRTLSFRVHSKSKALLYDQCIDDTFHSVYLMETIKYFLSLEWKYVLNDSFLNSDAIALKNRRLILNWLQQLQQSYAMSPTVFLSAVRLFDKVVATKKVPIHLYQLISMVTIWIVNKVDCSATIAASKFLKYCGYSYSVREFLKMEIKLLKFFKFDVVLPDPITFVCYYLKLLQFECKFKVLTACAAYVLESFTLHQHYSLVSPSFQAAAATYLSIRTLDPNFKQWDTLKKYPAYYASQEFQALKILMAEAVKDQQNPHCKCREPYMKYSLPELESVSLVFGDKLVDEGFSD